jgi:MATE family multidrug resistance protein
VLAIIILKHGTFRKYMAMSRRQWKLNGKTIRELLHIGVPSSLQLGMEVSAFAISGIIIGTISAVAQAAHQIALSCASFTFMVSMGLSQAGSIRVSNAYGRSDWTKIRVIGRTTLATALIYGSCCAVCFILFRRELPGLFNSNPEVVRLASVLLLFAAVFQISDSTQAIGAGLLRGIKDVKMPTWFISIAYWVVGLPAGYILAFHFDMRAPGIWLGFIAGLTIASVLLVIRFMGRAGKVKKTKQEVLKDGS